MSGTNAAAVRSDWVERYVSRIDAHLVRLATDHDPMGHLFGIERLARAARAEWREEQRRLEQERRGP